MLFDTTLQGAALWLPIVAMGIMGIAMLAYVILDGYDLGVGMLMKGQSIANKDVMISSIGPFWDANETWLVLGVGLMLTCFPAAHGVILGELYLPVTVMLVGLILRGVAFDFRVKARDEHRLAWNRAFMSGSLLAALSQGWMLGFYIAGFDNSIKGYAFALLIAMSVAAGYCLLGATWLIMKTEGSLQLTAVAWARRALLGTALGIAAISLATPMASERIFTKWFSLPYLLLLAPIPLATIALLAVMYRSLKRLPVRFEQGNEYGAKVPFFCTIGIFTLAFYGLAYSLFPYLVPEKITVWQAAISTESLTIILVGAAVVVPAIIGYTIFSYRVFSGKAQALSYT